VDLTVFFPRLRPVTTNNFSGETYLSTLPNQGFTATVYALPRVPTEEAQHILLEDSLPVYPTEVRGTAPKAHLCRHVCADPSAPRSG